MITRRNSVFLFLVFIILNMSANPNVMVTGFWNPTGQMIAPFSLDPELNPGGWIGYNWQEMGYDVFSYFPVPGQYTGDFEVDYQDTWDDFWAFVDELDPIAIISFGAGTGPWEIEYKARNLTSWVPDYEIPYMPTPNPPDDTVPVGYIRYSTLPVEAIEIAVEDNTTLNAWIDWYGNAGAFLCEYMFYLGTWYQSIHSSNFDENPCLASGFVHVAASTSVPLAQEAAFLTIEATLDYLNSFVDISGTIIAQDIDPTGTILTLDGNNTYTLEIDNLNGNFELPYIPSGVYDVAAVWEDYYYAFDQIEIDAENTVIEMELENWSDEDELFYAEDPENPFEGTVWTNYEIMTRYTQEELTGLTGSVLGKVSFYTPTSSDSCAIYVKIYEATIGDITPTDVLYEQEITEFTSNEHIVHLINMPIPIESDKEYWTGYEIESSNGKAGWFDNGTLDVDKGGWIKRGIWRQLDYYYDDPGNWVISAHIFSPDNSIAENDLLPVLPLNLTGSPNPFNPETRLSYQLAADTKVELNIYNLKGQKVVKLVDAIQNRGYHTVIWDGRDNLGNTCASGIYFSRIEAGKNSETIKLMLIK